ncbi:NAD(P)-dependent glycerol-3-phosphate dehydrogenase [Synergistaceae bacterium OttesenSCG-928-D05]|nr:NAD(P)-dependent glycerol-3-phosphate dehydrogenase [Synergistaceae bacterium OttesenSCG-928-D05]
MNITILGSGSFASAMAMHLAALDHSVLLWSIDNEQVDAINLTGYNTFCFKDMKLSENIKATLSLEKALDFSEWYIMAIPTQFEREVLEKIARITKAPGHMLNLAKGIEITTGNLLHTVHAEICPNFTYSALSGPSHAEEVAIGCPTCVALASKTPGEAEAWQKIINGNNFRIYTSDDVVGLEVGGATKNIYAVAAGIARAMELGDNAVAALACRGLAEIMRLGHKMGASPLTLSGLAGVGDLMVTCYSMHSRNFRLGLAIGQGKTFDQAVAELGQVAEGAYTVRAVVENSKKFEVELPLAESLYRVIYKNESPQALLSELLARPPKPEMRF